MIFELPLEYGKYKVLYDNGKIEILRHGEPWRDETGDGFLHTLLMSYIELEYELEAAEDKLGMLEEDSAFRI